MQTIPEFSLPATGGALFQSRKLQRKHLVLYFYPKDNTPGCTTESTQFRDHYAEFEQRDCALFGISRDSLKAHENFKAKLKLPFELLSDSDEVACQLFAVIKMKNLYGKQVRGIERSTFLFDKRGKLLNEWRGVKAATHVPDVLKFLKTL